MKMIFIIIIIILLTWLSFKSSLNNSIKSLKIMSG